MLNDLTLSCNIFTHVVMSRWATMYYLHIYSQHLLLEKSQVRSESFPLEV
jgi:hypothetical protein